MKSKKNSAHKPAADHPWKKDLLGKGMTARAPDRMLQSIAMRVGTRDGRVGKGC